MRVLGVLMLCLLGGCIASKIETKQIIRIDEELREKVAGELQKLEEDRSIVDELPNIIFDLIASIIKNSDIDPIELPDLEVGFQQGIFSGQLQLTEGSVGGFSDISRSGDAEVNLFILQRRANVKIPIYFEEFGIGYRYFTRFNLLGVDGRITGSIQGVTTVLDIDISLVDFSMILNEFSLDARRFVFRFEDNPWTDWMVNILLNIVTEFARGPILNAVEYALSLILNAIFGVV